MPYLLVFHNHLYDSNSLIEGRLLLLETQSAKIVDEFRATSGSPRWQEADEVSAIGRGSIPKNSDVGIDHYTVRTKPLDLSSVKGVEGAFYKIDPHQVQINGVARGDFGIHRDANVPGSAGCVVLTSQTGWQAFQRYMNELASAGIKQIPLLVSYSK